MSEKGQGEESSTGTATGIDGTASAGSGSTADQTGPHEGDTRTRERGPWSQPDPNAPEVDLGKPEIPPPPEDAGGEQEPTFPGGGPTDTRSGWEYPSGEGPRGDPAPDPGQEGTPEPQETAEQKAAREEDLRQRHERAYGEAMERRDRMRAEEEGQTQVDPPDLDSSGQSDEGPESIGKYNEDKPVIT